MKVEFEKQPPVLRGELDRGFKCNLPESIHFLANPKFIPASLSSLPLARIEPHKQYTISFQNLSAPEPLALAEVVGWRFFEWAPNGQLGARLVWTLHDQESGLIYFNIGRYVAGSITGFQAAEAMENAASYYFRILALPQIFVFAIWLHKSGGEDSEPPDFLIPVNPAPDTGAAPPPISPLEPLAPYSPVEFFRRAAELIRDAEIRAPAPNSEAGGSAQA